MRFKYFGIFGAVKGREKTFTNVGSIRGIDTRKELWTFCAEGF